MDRADIPIEVALSIVLAAAVDGSDRRGLLTALNGGLPAEGADDGRGPALVFAFPDRAATAPEHDPDGPAAA